MRSPASKGHKSNHIDVADAAGANRTRERSGSARRLPDMTELNHVLSKQLELNRSRRVTTEGRELLKAALGLTRDEAEKVYRKAQVTTGRLTETEVDIVLSEKTDPAQRHLGIHRRR
jgi:hypothetical protein